MTHFCSASVGALVVAASLVGAAQAQDAGPAPQKGSGSKVDEVVVTASKTGTQALQSTPLAIQAFSGVELKERNIETVGDLVSTIPGASEGFRQSAASRFYNLRGTVTANGDSPIGYYVDDVPFIVTNFGIAPPVRFIDMQRVEVLRGPQGTLYGQGSSGGVFIFHTRSPNLQRMEYAVEANDSQTVGGQGMNYGAAGAVSIPVIQDKLALRISGGWSRDAGYADEYYGPYDGTPDRKGVNNGTNDDLRAVALYQPLDNVNIRAQYWHFRPRQNFSGFTSSVDPVYFENTAGQPGYSNGDFTLYSISGTVDFEGFSITSATSHLDGDFGIHLPISPAGYFESIFQPKMFAEELRANSTGQGPLHWVVGAAYQDGQGPQLNTLSIPPAGIFLRPDNNTITKNHAFFGELSYDLFGGKLVPLVGLRTYHDLRTFKDTTTTTPTTKDVNTYRLNLSYIPTENLTMFVSVATGFRPGIVQSQVQVLSLAQNGIIAGTALDPEFTRNYELGVKWRTPDHALTLGLNLYDLKYTNLQSSATGAIPNVNGFANLGDATTRGVDIEAHWSTPIKGLNLSVVGNFNDSKYDKINPVVAGSNPRLVVGGRLLNTLAQNYRFDASYTRSIAKGFEGFANLGVSHNGDRLQNIAQVARPYDIVTTTVGVRHGRYELAFVGDNLTDERGPTFLGTTGPNSGSGPTPRTLGFRVRVTSD